MRWWWWCVVIMCGFAIFHAGHTRLRVVESGETHASTCIQVYQRVNSVVKLTPSALKVPNHRTGTVHALWPMEVFSTDEAG